MKLDDYNIIMPARIVEYFPANQTATVKICNDITTSNSTEDEIQTEPAHLYNVPVFTGGGGGWHITFPVKPDDTCLLNFSQFGYDHWLYKDADKAGVRAGGNVQPWTRRRFSLADGFAQVGWNNIPRAIDSYQSADAEFRNVDRAQRVTLKESGDIEVITGTTKITLSSDSVTIDSDSTVNVNTATANVTATTAANITAPMTTIDGDLTVTGLSTLTGAVSAVASVTTPLCTAGTVAAGAGAVTLSAAGAASSAPMTATEFTAGGVTLTGHTHAENGDGGGTTGTGQG